MKFYDALEIAMRLKGMKPADVCAKAGLYESYLSKLKNGHMKSVEWDKAIAIIDALGIFSISSPRFCKCINVALYIIQVQQEAVSLVSSDHMGKRWETGSFMFYNHLSNCFPKKESPSPTSGEGASGAPWIRGTGHPESLRPPRDMPSELDRPFLSGRHRHSTFEAKWPSRSLPRLHVATCANPQWDLSVGEQEDIHYTTSCWTQSCTRTAS